MRRLVAATGVVSIVVSAGCGGGSSASSGSSPSDVALANQINLQRSDFPAGWEARSNPVTAPANVNGEQALYGCLAAPTPDRHATANTNSPAFVLGAQQASSNVKLTPTAAQSQSDYAVLAKPAFGDCARRVLLDTLPTALPPGSSVTSSSVSSVPVTAPAEDRVTSSLVTANARVQGGETTVYAMFTTILHGRAVAAIQTIGLGEPFPASLLQTIVSSVEGRANQLPA